MANLEDLGQAIGLKPGEASQILQEVKENQAKLKSCDVHDFNSQTYVFGNRRYTCDKCGGWMSSIAIFDYCKGFKAAGGDPDKIMKGIV